MKVLGVGNAIVDVLCKVDDHFIQDHNLTKGTMKLIDKQEFKKILENKKRSWRYNNEFLRYLSWYKYQANSLITFDNTNDFRSDELEFIKQSSPTKTQQIIIPQFEINRLLNLYDVLDINQDIENPDLIVLKRGSLVEKYSFIDLSVYCRSNNFDIFKIYYKKINDICDQ